MNAQVQVAAADAAPIKLDLGCGKNKQAGFFGIDRRQFEGVDGVCDLTQPGRWAFTSAHLGSLALESVRTGWTLPDNSVDEVHCSHFLEHLHHNPDKPERVRFMNELYRVMKVGAKATIITPHWCSNRAYGDFTHADKPVSEMFYFYLNREWRKVNAPDNDAEWNPDGYTCNFDATWGHGMRQELWSKHVEVQTFALQNYKDAATDLIATIVKV